MKTRRAQRANDGSLPIQLQEVLPLVLQHAQDLSTAKNVCRLVQVSTAVRRAVQQSRGHCSFNFDMDPGLRPRLPGFATWLPAHCGLVSELELESGYAADSPDTAASAVAVLQLALRVCAERAAQQQPHQQTTAPATAAAAGDSSILQDAVPMPLRLSRFSADGALVNPAILRLLAALGLRDLQLQLKPAEVTAALCAALGRMRSIQELGLVLHAGVELPLRLAAAVGQLPQLTRLQVTSGVDGEAFQALPASLECLRLTAGNVRKGEALDLSHLTALSKVSIANETDERMQLVLPAQPGLRMQLEGGADIQPGSGLSRLEVAAYRLEDLHLVPSLPAQQHLRTLLLNSFETRIL